MKDWFKYQKKLRGLYRQQDEISRRYNSERAQLTDPEVIQQLGGEYGFEDSLVRDQIEVERSKYLLRAADRLLVEVPDRTDKDKWMESTISQQWVLSPKGAAELQRALIARHKEEWDLVVSVAVPVITALIGLGGTIIGIIALFR